MSTFADFIAPFDPVEFQSQYYGKRPLHIRRAGSAGENPLPWKRFNEALAITPYWNEETLKVFYKNRLALKENYCDLSTASEGGKSAADPQKVKALLGLGASLVANHIHRVCPEVDRLCHMLQRTFAATVGANVYCSFKHVQAFNTHFDLHDVFAFQAEGEKTWRIYETRADNPVSPLPPGDEVERWLIESRGKVLFEARMQPGDILYLPRGQYHDAITGDDASLHVTYWVKPATGLALFKILETAAMGDRDFRAYLAAATDKQALGAQLTHLAHRIQEMATSSAFLVDVQNHQRALARPPADFDLPHRKPPTFYSVTKKGQVRRSPQGFVAVVDRAELDVGAAGSAIGWALQQRLFSIEDLTARYPFVDETELRSILQRLVQLGAIVETEMR
jgi:ribosomal protein L16 Arg81 hydroxylase